MITEEMQKQILDGIQALAVALSEQRRAAIEHGEADHAYRQGQASTYLRIMAESEGSKKPTEPHIKALVDTTCSEQMLRVRLAEAAHESANKLVDSLRQQLSAWQTIVGAHRAEADAVRYQQAA